MSGHSRRRLLQGGGVAVISVLAGCSSVTDQLSGDSGDDETAQQTTTEDEKTQQYTIPPVAELQGDGVPDDGTVRLEALFEPATTAGDPNVYFEDELTFELFVYDTYPVGNNVSLTKVAEENSTPYETISVSLDAPFSELPKNEQMRFRLKITNNKTGDSEWQMDQRVFRYEQYDNALVAVKDLRTWTVLEGDSNFPRSTFVEEGDGYYMNFPGGREFPAPSITEEVPYSREAYKTENDLYVDGNGPVCKPFQGRRIEIPETQVKLADEFMNRGLNESYNSFTYSRDIPSEYDYYGRNTYDVLNNPIYQKMAETINGSNEVYDINNHYSKIGDAALTIQSNEYDALGAGSSLRSAPLHLPESYWTDPTENCVGHSYQLCWLLYHIGYTCGVVHLDRTGAENSDHLAACMPIPESVMESDFPEGYPETFHNSSSATRYIDTLSDIVNPDIQPDTLGDHPWVYIEATAPTSIGVIPFDNIREARVRYAIEPENNVFGTDIGVDT